ncbi:MAG: ADP-heptose--LPS heptosyltransferase 2 [Chlamydiales bacterium]|nr:ADP-heptose--LPS heptosyltransferase 2 [Chlamydiales bacterium]MCH9636220.1 ADP-heptose--LPS heptosyltransferase 2 [Chlamydiales bacterium]MCH9703795.1 glycosyltransferase family 9 protein [Chlamydiota bacterium]
MSKVAIIRRNGFGDLLCTYPLVLYFKKYFPQTELTLFADERNAPLLPYLPHIDQKVVLPTSGNKYLQAARVGMRFRKQRFDMAISGKTSPMKLMDFFLFALGAKQRVAPVAGGWHRHLINAPIQFDEKEAKLTHQALKALRTVEPGYTDVPEEFFPKIEMRGGALEHSLQGPILLLSASTTRPTSRFDPFRYSEVVNRVYQKSGFSVLIVGQKRDEIRAKAIAQGLRLPYLLHFPRSFDEFMASIHASDYFFGGDGGVAHIAAAMNKRQVVLFGETNPKEWAPLSLKARTFYDRLHVNRLDDDQLENAVLEMMSGNDCRD